MTVFEMACKIKELEELKEIKSAHSRMTKVQSQLSTASSYQGPYFEHLNQFNSGYGEAKYVQNMVNNQYKFVNLRPCRPNEVLNSIPPSLGYGQSIQKNAPDDLLYKIFRGDTKLVRSIFEAN